MDKEVILRALKKPQKIPVHIYNEGVLLKRRRQTHSLIIEMVSDVLNEPRTKISEFYNDLADNKQLVEDIADFGNIKGHYAIPNQAVLAYLCCRSANPNVVVETGVHTGTSSAVILQALTDNGNGILHSIDLPGTEEEPVVDPSSPYGEVRYELSDESEIGKNVREDLRDNWKLHFGRSEEVLESLLDDLESLDIFLHDSDHSYENMHYEFETSYNYLSKDGLIISDDIDWNNSFQEFANQHSANWGSLMNLVSDEMIPKESMVGIARFE